MYDEKIGSIEETVKYAIVANIIDFNPIHADVEKDIDYYFSNTVLPTKLKLFQLA